MLAERHDDVPLLDRDKPAAPTPVWQPQVVAPSEPPKQPDVPKPPELELAHEPTLVKESVKDEPELDLPVLARDPELNPAFKAGSFEPPPSEPRVVGQSQPVSIVPEPPKPLNDQIHIDAD